MKFSSLFSVLALFSARFSRIDLPTFLAAPLLGDFPDIGITPFFACVTRYHTHFYFFIQSCKRPRKSGTSGTQRLFTKYNPAENIALPFISDDQPSILFFSFAEMQMTVQGTHEKRLFLSPLPLTARIP
ncbi:hypothetical protein [Arthrobacter sedimenti]|uniref:Secreted protein n=1 Tax=Arthrobacter sedimenti TaxID=2694931 RepID=A0ABV8WLW8_9MICC